MKIGSAKMERKKDLIGKSTRCCRLSRCTSRTTEAVSEFYKRFFLSSLGRLIFAQSDAALWRVEGTDKFYIAAYQSLSSVLAHLVAKGDFSQPDKRRSTSSPELEVVASLLNLAYDIELKRDSQDHEDEVSLLHLEQLTSREAE